MTEKQKNVITVNEKEYNFANKLYKQLDFAAAVSRYIKEKDFSFVGSPKSGASLTDQEE